MRYLDSFVSLKREEAAEVCGITDAQLKQWHDRGHLFPENRVGKGFRIQYGLRDLFTIRTAGALTESGLSVIDTCNMLRSVSVFGFFLHNPGCGFTAHFTGGKWQAIGGAATALQIEVNLVEVAKFIWGRLKPGLIGLEEAGIADAITHFERAIEQREHERNEIVRAFHLDQAERAAKGEARFA